MTARRNQDNGPQITNRRHIHVNPDPTRYRSTPKLASSALWLLSGVFGVLSSSKTADLLTISKSASREAEHAAISTHIGYSNNICIYTGTKGTRPADAKSEISVFCPLIAAAKAATNLSHETDLDCHIKMRSGRGRPVDAQSDYPYKRSHQTATELP